MQADSYKKFIKSSSKALFDDPGVMNHKELKKILIQLKEQGLREVVEANDMDKLMRLDCHEDYGSACRSCNVSGPKCPKKREKREQIRKV